MQWTKKCDVSLIKRSLERGQLTIDATISKKETKQKKRKQKRRDEEYRPFQGRPILLIRTIHRPCQGLHIVLVSGLWWFSLKIEKRKEKRKEKKKGPLSLSRVTHGLINDWPSTFVKNGPSTLSITGCCHNYSARHLLCCMPCFAVHAELNRKSNTAAW